MNTRASLIFVGLMATALTGCQTPKPLGPRHLPSVPLTPIIISEAEKALKNVLKDPGSAQINSLFAVRELNFVDVCGLVNAKNGYGGYTGFLPFVAKVGVSVASDGSTTYFAADAAPADPEDADANFFVFYKIAPYCKP